MSVFALLTAAGAPGATTTALGLASLWPRACLIVEADMAGSSSVLAGHLRGTVRHDRGLVGLAIAHQQRDLGATDLWDQAIGVLTERAYIIPGIADPGQGGNLSSLWPPLIALLGGLDEAGTDVLVDAGRVSQRNAPAALVSGADLALVVMGSSLRDVAAARSSAPSLLRWRGEAARSGSGLMVVGPRRPYSVAEIESVVGLPVLAVVEWDPRAAAVLSAGATRPRRWGKGRLASSYATAALALTEAAAARRQWLRPVTR